MPTMSPRIVLLLSLFYTTCADLTSQAINGLDLPADPVPIKLQFFNSYAPHVYNYNYKSFPASCDSGENEWFVIQTTNGLVVDGSDPKQVKIGFSTGSPSQIWKFVRAGVPGVYYVVNNGTGAALDWGYEKLEADDKGDRGNKIPILKNMDGSLTQRWFTNWNGRLRNVDAKLNLDVDSAIFENGRRLILWLDNGGIAQEFTFRRTEN